MTADALRIAELERENILLREKVNLFELMQEKVAALEQQVAWFQRQIFGSRSERRFEIDPVLQGNLFAEFGLEDSAEHEEPEDAPVRAHRRKKRRDQAVNDSGLRFDESVPVETIFVTNHEAEKIAEEERVEIGEKVVCRVAQEIGSYRVLRYVMKTYKRKDTGELLVCPAPANVLERSCADVSLLAGMLVDKYQWHLPLYR